MLSGDPCKYAGLREDISKMSLFPDQNLKLVLSLPLRHGPLISWIKMVMFTGSSQKQKLQVSSPARFDMFLPSQ